MLTHTCGCVCAQIQKILGFYLVCAVPLEDLWTLPPYGKKVTHLLVLSRICNCFHAQVNTNICCANMTMLQHITAQEISMLQCSYL